MSPVLEVRDLHVDFDGAPAVRGVGFTLDRGEVLGIVGESGSGKSVTSLAVMGLLPDNATARGSVRLGGRELLGASDAELSRIRGEKIAMVFQDPMSALTPVYRVGDQIAEAILAHRDTTKQAARARAVELLDLVGIPEPDVRAKAFPHEFSGGMRQRVVIAMAIANDPDVILADEPTTALDVTIQAQVLDVLRTAQRETGAAMVLVSHDLGVIAGAADRVAVMYAGRIVESAPVDELFARPVMPYTLGLIGAVPRLDGSGTLVPVPGAPPAPDERRSGRCPFVPRCPMADERCDTGEPPLVALQRRSLTVPSGPAERSEPAGEGRSATPLLAKSPVDEASQHLAACVRSAEIAAAGLAPTDVFPVPAIEEEAAAAPDRSELPPVLRVSALTKTFPLLQGAVFKRRVGSVHAVDGVELDIRRGETLGLVGESGSGKSTTLFEVLELGEPEAGSVDLFGRPVRELTRQEKLALRSDMQIVFQDPMASLDPRMPVGEIVAEPLRAQRATPERIAARVPELLRTVGLEEAHAGRFPHEFSGGQRQRIAIARALAVEPRLLVLDEPVSALDVSIQAGVLNLLRQLKADLGIAYLFVSHDLSVVRYIADRVSVMYLGRTVESGSVEDVFERPHHPYTQALLSAVPLPDPKRERERTRILLEGDPPNAWTTSRGPARQRPPGCRFRSRCPVFATLGEKDRSRCENEDPELTTPTGDHLTACHFPTAREVV